MIEAAGGTNEGMPLEKQRLTDAGQTEVAHEVHRNTDRCSGEIGDWLKMLGPN